MAEKSMAALQRRLGLGTRPQGPQGHRRPRRERLYSIWYVTPSPPLRRALTPRADMVRTDNSFVAYPLTLPFPHTRAISFCNQGELDPTLWWPGTPTAENLRKPYMPRR